ncbi:MAG: DUF2474 family protein [Burkholderiaceae bacterium]
MPARPDDAHRPSWPKRIAWMIGLWIMGVLALGLVAGLLRLLMNAAGLTA